MQRDTITAIATPMGRSGIGVIRISGPRSASILQALFHRRPTRDQRSGANARHRLRSHMMYHGYIIHPEDNYVVDEVLVVAMRAPRSFTREDVVEIQSHSGAVVLSTILSLIIGQGARLAEPGEFTKRAFLNGRIDLSQAEAIADMVSAKTEAGMNLAAVQLSGGMREKVHQLHVNLDALRQDIEAGIEFSADIGPEHNTIDCLSALQNNLVQPVSALLSAYSESHVLRDGIRIDIIGKPNVGKSSLLNCFLQKEKAIVTEIPGTTRDLVEDYTAIEGIPILITDTAGLHESGDPVEQAGMRKTRESLQRSDLVLFVLDGSQEPSPQDLEIWAQVAQKNVLLVINKIDLVKHVDAIDLKGFTPESNRVYVSAKFGNGISRLKKAIKADCLKNRQIDRGWTLVPSMRQKTALDAMMVALKRAAKALENGGDLGLVMEDLNDAKEQLSIISGDAIGEELLDQIFNRFCIGK